MENFRIYKNFTVKKDKKKYFKNKKNKLKLIRKFQFQNKFRVKV